MRKIKNVKKQALYLKKMEEKYDHNEYVKQISENKNIEDPDSLFNLESSEINDVFVYS